MTVNFQGKGHPASPQQAPHQPGPTRDPATGRRMHANIFCLFIIQFVKYLDNILLLHARYEQIMYSCATAHRRGRHKECVVGTEINRFLSPGRGAETESAGLAAGGRAS